MKSKIGDRVRGWWMFSRLGLAWHVLRGRPLMYKILVDDGTVVMKDERSIAHSCVIKNSPGRLPATGRQS